MLIKNNFKLTNNKLFVLKEITHKGLARLVGLYGSYPIDSNNLQTLELASVEPDRQHKEEINKGAFKAMKTSIEWLVDHTIRAKELAIHYIKEATKAYNSGDHSWSRWLGWCFHFITDWATPYHSATSKSNPILDSTDDILNKASENDEGLLMTTLKVVSNLIKFKIGHDNFENECEERWQQNESIIQDTFIKSKNNRMPFVDLKVFNEMLDDLRLKCKNLPADWSIKSTNQEFARYMTDIVIVMDVACSMVLG